MNSMIELMKARHSVRSYFPTPVETEKIDALKETIDKCNEHPGLNFQLVTDEPNAFDGTMAHYGKFSGVRNYIALIAQKGLDEAVGYYGEKIVLQAQSLGLNTCWVALTFSKKKTPCKVDFGEKFYIAIPFGYGAVSGNAHKSKSLEELSSSDIEMPDWFRNGVEAAMLAPTAMNKQKFKFILKDGEVTAEKGFAPSAEISLGIAKYHFEIGSEKEGLFKL